MNYKEAVKDDIFRVIGSVADELGQPCFVIGGYVRDYFLGREGHKDIDVVTLGSGIGLAEAVNKKLGGGAKISVFKNFGTAMIRHKDMELEFVGARRESYESDSRKPFVEEGSLEDDQNRRDFTINALAIGLNADNFGELVDPFDGVGDLERKIIRTPLDADITYSDDPLRMMRAIRFASQLGFEIEEDSFKAITRNKERIKIISNERIVVELNKILLSKKPSVGLKLLHDSELIGYILPEVLALKGVEEQEGKRHKDNFWHTLEVVDNIRENTDNVWLIWAALLHDIGKAPTKRFDKKLGWTFHGHEFVGSKMVAKLFYRLRMPQNEKMKYVQKIVMMSSRPIVIATDVVTDSAVRRLLFDAGEDFEDLMTLCNADITTKNPKRYEKYHKNFEIVKEKVVEVEAKDHIRNFQPPISGEDIMRIFGLQPCREVGALKDSIKDAILDGSISNNYEEAYEYMMRKAGKMGLVAQA